MNRTRYHELRRERHAIGEEAKFHRGQHPGANRASAERLGRWVEDIDSKIRRQGPGAEPWRLMMARWESRRALVRRQIAERKSRAYWDDFGARCRALRDSRRAAETNATSN